MKTGDVKITFGPSWVRLLHVRVHWTWKSIVTSMDFCIVLMFSYYSHAVCRQWWQKKSSIRRNISTCGIFPYNHTNTHTHTYMYSEYIIHTPFKCRLFWPRISEPFLWEFFSFHFLSFSISISISHFDNHNLWVAFSMVLILNDPWVSKKIVCI